MAKVNIKSEKFTPFGGHQRESDHPVSQDS